MISLTEEWSKRKSFVLAYQLVLHQVTQNYDLLPQQLSPVRGGYLIIAREGLVQQGYVDVFAEFKKTQGFDVTVVSLSDSELDVSNVQNYITNHFIENPMLSMFFIGDVDGLAKCHRTITA